MSKLDVIPVKCDGCGAIQKPGESGWLSYFVAQSDTGLLAAHFEPMQNRPILQACSYVYEQRDACGERCMIVDIHRLLGFAGSPCAEDQLTSEERGL